MSEYFQSTATADSYNENATKDKLRPGRAYKEDLASRWDQYTNDPMSLGLSDAEMKDAMARSQQAAMAGQQAAVTELNRGALAGQGFQAGAMGEAAQKLTDQGTEAAAKASSQVEDLNTKLIENRVAQLRQELIGQRNHNEQQVQQYTDLSVDALMGILEMFAPTGGA